MKKKKIWYIINRFLLQFVKCVSTMGQNLVFFSFLSFCTSKFESFTRQCDSLLKIYIAISFIWANFDHFMHVLYRMDLPLENAIYEWERDRYWNKLRSTWKRKGILCSVSSTSNTILDCTLYKDTLCKDFLLFFFKSGNKLTLRIICYHYKHIFHIV